MSSSLDQYLQNERKLYNYEFGTILMDLNALDERIKKGIT